MSVRFQYDIKSNISEESLAEKPQHLTFPIIKSSFHRVLLSTFYFILYFYIDGRITQCEENVVLKGNNSVFIFISTVNYPGIFIIGDIN